MSAFHFVTSFWSLTLKDLLYNIKATTKEGKYNAQKIILAAAIALIAILSLSFFTACDDEEVQARAIDLDSAQYRIFFDDFDGELDTTVWNTLHERRKGGYWDKDQVLTENGNLVIRTVEKDGTFYTGAVDSMNKKELLFGYFEARCYLPKASGIWSAF